MYKTCFIGLISIFPILTPLASNKTMPRRFTMVLGIERPKVHGILDISVARLHGPIFSSGYCIDSLKP
jgi:hypothetical protein